jgi:C_GCAxxG_C_C family probable redox protein
MNQKERAVACFDQAFNCAQAVLSTYGPQLGLEHELALRVAGALGAGMGRLGETCGAVTGAFMLIGLKHGKTQPEDNESKERGYQLVREFAAEFESRHGSIKCRELLGCSIETPEQLELAKERELFETLCPRFIHDAAEIVEQLLILGG